MTLIAVLAIEGERIPANVLVTKDVLTLIDVSRTQLQNMIAEGLFPRPEQFVVKNVTYNSWTREEIIDWLTERCTPPPKLLRALRELEDRLDPVT